MGKMTLKALRINAGLKQTDVAKALKVSNKTVSSWENGYTYPKPKYIDAICNLYNVEYDHINFLHNNSL